MVNQILNLIVQPILGGLAGYITNEYAINMLFKSYTPLKIGGVIPKTRKEFINNLSQLVEDDLITKDNIKETIQSEAFISNFQDLVNDFFTKSIYENTESLPLKDIQPLNEALENIKNFTSTYIKENFIAKADALFTEISFTDIINARQSKEIATNIINLCKKTINETSILENIIDDFISLDNFSPKYLLGDDTSDILASNIVNNIFDKEYIKENYDDKIDLLIDELLKRSNAYSTFTVTIENILFTKKEDFISFASVSLEKYIKSDDFKKAIEKSINCLLNSINNSNTSLYELIMPNYFDELRENLKMLFPEIANVLIQFTKEHEFEIIQLLKESADETINEQAKSKQALLKLAKGKIDNVINNINAVDSISSYLKNEEIENKIIDTILEKIQLQLQTYTLSDLSSLISNKKLLNPEIVNKYIDAFAQKNLHNILEKLYFSLPLILNSDVANKFITNLAKKTIKNKIIYSDNLEKIIKESLKKELILLLSYNQKNIKDISTDKIKILKSAITSIISDNENKLIDFISNKINDFVSDKTIKDLLFENQNIYLYENLQENVILEINKIKKQVENINLHTVFNKLNSVNNLQSKTSKIIRNIVIDNIDTLLQGLIKGIVTSNLNKLNDEELCALAKGFMGNNLKPIMIFGGILGIIAGVILAVFYPNSNLLSIFSISSMITFALVGFLTNAIAINMLFKPYNKNKFLSKIPLLKVFSIGYIPKNKETLAESISKEIKEKLLSKESLATLINENSENIIDIISSYLSKNNYSLLENLAAENKHKLLKNCPDFLYNEISKNLNEICSKLTIEICKLQINEISFNNFISNYFIDSKPNISNAILQKIINFKEENANINDYLPICIKNILCENFENYILNKIISYTNDISLSSISNLLDNKNEQYINVINAPISKLIGITNLDNINLKNEHLDGLGVFSIINKSFSNILVKPTNNYIRSLFSNIENKSKSLFSLISPAISDKIKEKVTSSLGFIAVGAYKMLGGDKIIDNVVEKALIDKLPTLIANNSSTLEKQTLDCTNNLVLPIIKNPLDKNTITNYTNLISKPFFDDLLKINCINLLRPLSLDSIDNIFINYKTDIEKFIKSCKTLLHLQAPYFASVISKEMLEMLNNKLSYVNGKDILKNIDNKEIYKFLNNLFSDVFPDQVVRKITSTTTKNILLIEPTLNADLLLNEHELNSSLQLTIPKLINNKFINKEVENTLNTIYDLATKDGIKVLGDNTKKYIVFNSSKSIIHTLNNKLSNLLSQIEFDKMAKEQINKMSSKKIHIMFNSFAGKYFSRLMIYGFMGLVFGINIYIGFGIATIYCISKLIKYKNGGKNDRKNKTTTTNN